MVGSVLATAALNGLHMSPESKLSLVHVTRVLLGLATLVATADLVVAATVTAADIAAATAGRC